MTANPPAWLHVSVILISLLGFLAIYFLVGTMVRYHKGMRHFPEVLPNYRCWCRTFSIIAMVLTCGQCRSRYVYQSNMPNRVGAFMTGLPSRPRASHLAFEALQSDWEDEYVEEAMSPASSVKIRTQNELQV